MLTVTKTSDDDTAQTITLPTGIAGTVHVRVTDTDRTPGNQFLDTLSIDEMYFKSESAPPLTDEETWRAQYPGADLNDLSADLDGDGLSNDEERIWGLDPANGSPANPITVTLNAAAGTFSYTRRDPSLTGLTYTVWTSTNLQD